MDGSMNSPEQDPSTKNEYWSNYESNNLITEAKSTSYRSSNYVNSTNKKECHKNLKQSDQEYISRSSEKKDREKDIKNFTFDEGDILLKESRVLRELDTSETKDRHLDNKGKLNFNSERKNINSSWKFESNGSNNRGILTNSKFLNQGEVKLQLLKSRQDAVNKKHTTLRGSSNELIENKINKNKKDHESTPNQKKSDALINDPEPKTSSMSSLKLVRKSTAKDMSSFNMSSGTQLQFNKNQGTHAYQNLNLTKPGKETKETDEEKHLYHEELNNTTDLIAQKYLTEEEFQNLSNLKNSEQCTKLQGRKNSINQTLHLQQDQRKSRKNHLTSPINIKKLKNNDHISTLSNENMQSEDKL